MSNEIQITAANFETEVARSSVPVLVDFWAEWCMPCRMIAPSLEQIADAYKGRYKIGKVNVDTETELAEKFQVQSIPTILVFKNGELVKTHVGAAPRTRLEDDLVKPFI
jgi:thioredoxin 1